MATIKQLLTEACSKLNGPESAQEAELLMQDVCGISRSHQFSHPDEALTEQQVQQYRNAVQRLQSGEPLSYITGRRGFWDMDLRVTPEVLIPRPDTECLVEQALARIPNDAAWQIADLGTGSGAIAIAIARERPQCELTATDLSAAALAIASENARALRVENIHFFTGSWGQALDKRRYDMIVSNPPYIRSDDPHLQQGGLPAEPEHALVSGADGLDDIRQIITESTNHLKPGGWLLLEHGYEQAEEVDGLMRQSGFTEIFTRQDYGGNDRVTGGRRAD